MLYKIIRKEDKPLLCQRKGSMRSMADTQVQAFLSRPQFKWSWDIPEYCERNEYPLYLVVPKEFL